MNANERIVLSPRVLSRAGGLLYLLVIALGVIQQIFIRGPLFIRGGGTVPAWHERLPRGVAIRATRSDELSLGASVSTWLWHRFIAVQSILFPQWLPYLSVGLRTSGAWGSLCRRRCQLSVPGCNTDSRASVGRWCVRIHCRSCFHRRVCALPVAAFCGRAVNVMREAQKVKTEGFPARHNETCCFLMRAMLVVALVCAPFLLAQTARGVRGGNRGARRTSLACDAAAGAHETDG